MIARCLGLVAVAFVLIAPPLGEAHDELLRVEASVVPRRLSRGEAGKMVLRLGVEAGVTLSPPPQVFVQVEPCEEGAFFT